MNDRSRVMRVENCFVDFGDDLLVWRKFFGPDGGEDSI